jgi:hypothetical protein
MNGTGAKLGAALMCAAAIALASDGPAQAQGKLKQWSDDSVRCVMNYAWELTPATYTGPDGKTIVVDKKKKKEVDVPLEVGREAVETGRVSAFAQDCGLPEEQTANQRTFMRRAEQSKIKAGGKYTPQQMLYIRTIHLTTVALITGQLQAVDLDQGKKFSADDRIPVCEGVQIRQRPPPSKLTPCTDKQKAQVRALITEYINASPEGAPAKTAEPAKAGTKKK